MEPLPATFSTIISVTSYFREEARRFPSVPLRHCYNLLVPCKTPPYVSFDIAPLHAWISLGELSGKLSVACIMTALPKLGTMTAWIET